jgi:predicted DNA-binding transcriptional regulator YafY
MSAKPDISCQRFVGGRSYRPAMSSGRLLSILMLLQARRRVTAGELAAELDVSRRTVYRDLDALAAAGVPVYAEQGRAGGYRLVDGYRTRLTGLTEDEALSLFVLGLPEPAAALGLGEQAASAERKLLAALAPAQRVRAGVLRDRFRIDTSGWYQPAEEPPQLAALARCVLQDREVEVTYRRWKAPREVERRLRPYGLVLKGSAWYLVAECAGRLRTYRVANVVRLVVTEERFFRRTGFTLSEYWRDNLEDFDRRRLDRTAVVRLSPRLVAGLPDLPDPALVRAAREVAPDADGWTTVTLPIEHDAVAVRQLIGHGGEVEVLSPASLRDALVARARAVLTRHPG